jgi:hypothetical protein
MRGLVAPRGGSVTHAREVEEILATWREVERALELAEPGSAAFERLASDAALLRDEYQRLVDLAQAEEGTRSELPASS